MRSLTVAEQEFGRIIRRVQGRPLGKFPDYHHENWGVVVTHEMLEIGPLFQKFIEGMPTAPLSGYGETPSLTVEPTLEKPRLTSEYEAGETTLTLTNTQTLKPGDLILLSATIQPVAQPVPKFDLVEELRSTGSLSIDNLKEAVNPQENLTATSNKTPQQIPLPIEDNQHPKPSITDRVVDMIAEHLQKSLETRTVSVRVEAVLDNHTVQIAPIWSDLPIGTDLVKKPLIKQPIPETQTNFIHHLGLDWTILAEGEWIKFSDYRKRVVLRRHNLDL
jgi:hypothetical protein